MNQAPDALIRFLDTWVGRAAALRAYDELVDYLRREYETDPAPKPACSPTSSRRERIPWTPRGRGNFRQPKHRRRSGPSRWKPRPQGHPAHRKGISATTAGIAGALPHGGVWSRYSRCVPPGPPPRTVVRRRRIPATRSRWRRVEVCSGYRSGTARTLRPTRRTSVGWLCGLPRRNPYPVTPLQALVISQANCMRPDSPDWLHVYALSTVFGGHPTGGGLGQGRSGG